MEHLFNRITFVLMMSVSVDFFVFCVMVIPMCIYCDLTQALYVDHGQFPA